MEKILTATEIKEMTYEHEMLRDKEIEAWFYDRNNALFKELLNPLNDLLEKQIEVEE